MNIFDIYHQITKNTEKILEVFHDSSEGEVVETPVTVKVYPRFKKIPLPSPRALETSLTDTLLARKSSREFVSKVDVSTISSILFYSLGKKETVINGIVQERRMYPSPGALYPLEFYLFIFSPIGVLSEGVYHYGYEDNSLTCIRRNVFDKEIMKSIVMYEFARSAKFAVVITATFSRIFEKYKERALHFALLEAGGVAHNLTLCATSLGVGSVQMSGIIDSKAEEILRVDGSDECVIHSVFFG